ncbi:MAG: hypothetical protein ACRD0N_14730 [Acidimicrobiales bacterium]
MLTGWYVGYVIAAVVIAAVVVLVAMLLGLARTITVQAYGIADALHRVRKTTAPLPLVAAVNDDLGVIVNRAVEARAVVESGA